jgi:hypothetical protein
VLDGSRGGSNQQKIWHVSKLSIFLWAGEKNLSP